MRTVDDLKIGEEATIIKYKIKGELGKHLREMGLIKGNTVKLQRRAPLNYPIEIKIQGFSLALRKEEAQSIEIQ